MNIINEKVFSFKEGYVLVLLALILIGLCVFMFFYYNKKLNTQRKQIYAYMKTTEGSKEKKNSDTKQNTESKE